jgi:hypothetical protein
MTEENHQLCDYLNETLPTLSLDPETYLPYITGCLDTFQDEDDEFDEIIALLQASSESHSDDEQIWPKLKEEILRRYEEFNHEVEQQKKQNEDERRAIEAAKKKLDTEDAYREKERKRLAELEKTTKIDMDPAKKALIEQYAYDTSEIYDNDGKVVDQKASGKGKGKDKDKDAEEEPTSNKGLAEKINKEHSQQMRSGSQTTSKKDERMKTKQAKLDKVKQKEERRKKSTKGERKR